MITTYRILDGLMVTNLEGLEQDIGKQDEEWAP